MTTVTTLDKVCKNIGRLPLELRHAIFNCLTIDFRLEMVLQKTAQIIRTLFEAYTERLLDITALKHVVDKAIRFQFFYRKWTNDPLKIRTRLMLSLPSIEFKQMGETISKEHPVINALRKIVIIPKIYGNINSKSHRRWATQHAFDALNKIVSCISKTWDIIPTITVPSGSLHQENHGNCGDKFNYRIRKNTFNSICTLTKFVSQFKVPLEERALEKLKIKHKKLFFKEVIKRIPVLAQQMQRKIKLSAKKAEKAEKVAAAQAKKDTKAAAAQAKKDAKVAAAQAKKETKAAAAQAKKETKAAAKKANDEEMAHFNQSKKARKTVVIIKNKRATSS
jgi:hypothetical protein